MYTDIRGLLTFTHVDSVYVSVTVVPYVPCTALVEICLSYWCLYVQVYKCDSNKCLYVQVYRCYSLLDCGHHGYVGVIYKL